MKRIILSVILCLSVWFVFGGVALGATVISKQLNATVRVVSKGDFSYYSDSAATQAITSIALPDVTPGGTTTFTVYVKNTSTTPIDLAAGANNIPAATGTLSLTFDGAATKTLAAGAVSKVVGTLVAPASAPQGSISFAFNIDGAPSAGGTTTTTTTPPGTTTTTSIATVSYNTSVQSAFNSYCIQCHGSSGGVSLSSWGATTTSRYGSSAIVVPGNAASSILYQSVSGGSMSGYGMSAAQVQALANWINQGALNN